MMNKRTPSFIVGLFGCKLPNHNAKFYIRTMEIGCFGLWGGGELRAEAGQRTKGIPFLNRWTDFNKYCTCTTNYTLCLCDTFKFKSEFEKHYNLCKCVTRRFNFQKLGFTGTVLKASVFKVQTTSS